MQRGNGVFQAIGQQNLSAQSAAAVVSLGAPQAQNMQGTDDTTSPFETERRDWEEELQNRA